METAEGNGANRSVHEQGHFGARGSASERGENILRPPPRKVTDTPPGLCSSVWKQIL